MKFSLSPPTKQLDFSRGSYEIYQHKPFLEIQASYYKKDIVDIDGVYMLATKRPMIGLIEGKVGSPEGSQCSEWMRCLSQVSAAKIEVLTNQRIPGMDKYLNSDLETYSMVLDLSQSLDDLWLNLEKRCRRAITSSKKFNVSFHSSKSVKDIETFYSLLRKNAKNGSLFPIPPLDLLNQLIGANCAHLLLATSENKIIGGVVLLVHQHAYGWLTAFDYGLKKGLSSNILLWEAICWSKSANLRAFDFGAQCITDNSSIALFKRSFSPSCIPFYRYHLEPSKYKSVIYKQAQKSRALIEHLKAGRFA